MRRHVRKCHLLSVPEAFHLSQNISDGLATADDIPGNGWQNIVLILPPFLIEIFYIRFGVEVPLMSDILSLLYSGVKHRGTHNSSSQDFRANFGEKSQNMAKNWRNLA